jgi:YD repeat-containing protein
MPLLGALKLMAISVETSKGTAVPGATNCLAYAPKIELEPANFIQRQFSKTHMGNGPGIVATRIGKCTFRTELRSGSTNALDPACLLILEACGWKLTSSTYAPSSTLTDHKTITIDLWENGRLKRLFGAAGTCKIEGEAGKPVYLNCTFTGLFAAVTDASPPSGTPSTRVPILLAGATITGAAAFSKLTIDDGNKVQPVEDVSAAGTSGIAYFAVTGRDYTMTYDPESVLVATTDRYGLWIAGTPAAFSMLLSDGTVNVTIAGPALQCRQMASGDRHDILTDEITGQFNASSGDDELTIVTAAHA